MSDQQIGEVVGLYTTQVTGGELIAAEMVEAVAGRGLVGDRYYLGTGYYSGKKGWGANVTLIESEAIAAINAGHQTEFTAAMLRRNIVTARTRLEKLIGHEFRCGDAILRGIKPFPPCTHLAHLTGQPAILRYLAYCGGIGAEVIHGGPIRLHDLLERTSPTSQ
jgi:MOSC domain-containing protein YiiM